MFAQSKGVTRSLYVLSKSDGKVVPYLADGFDHPQAALSHDDRWLAYTSNETGNYQVIVQPFPDPSRGKWPISADSGLAPRWARDGRELFYLATDGRIMAVPVHTNPTPTVGTPIALFAATGRGWRNFEVTAGGRFIAIVRDIAANAQPLNVVLNWTADVAR